MMNMINSRKVINSLLTSSWIGHVNLHCWCYLREFCYHKYLLSEAGAVGAGAVSAAGVAGGGGGGGGKTVKR